MASDLTMHQEKRLQVLEARFREMLEEIKDIREFVEQARLDRGFLDSIVKQEDGGEY